jgi:predicted transposase YdaD
MPQPYDATNKALLEILEQRVRTMRESATWQAIFQEGEQKGKEEGKVEGMRDLLLHLGTRRFGLPDAVTQAAIAEITDLSQLQALSDRLLDVSSWQDLLPATPPKPRRGRKRTT